MNTLNVVKASNKKMPVRKILDLILFAFLIFSVLNLAFGRFYYIQCSADGCQLDMLKFQVEVQRLEP